MATLQDIYHEVMEMKPGEIKTFDMDYPPSSGNLGVFVGSITRNHQQMGENTSIIARTSGFSLTIECFSFSSQKDTTTE